MYTLLCETPSFPPPKRENCDSLENLSPAHSYCCTLALAKSAALLRWCRRGKNCRFLLPFFCAPLNRFPIISALFYPQGIEKTMSWVVAFESIVGGCVGQCLWVRLVYHLQLLLVQLGSVFGVCLLSWCFLNHKILSMSLNRTGSKNLEMFCINSIEIECISTISKKMLPNNFLQMKTQFEGSLSCYQVHRQSDSLETLPKNLTQTVGRSAPLSQPTGSAERKRGSKVAR